MGTGKYLLWNTTENFKDRVYCKQQDRVSPHSCFFKGGVEWQKLKKFMQGK